MRYEIQFRNERKYNMGTRGIHGTSGKRGGRGFNRKDRKDRKEGDWYRSGCGGQVSGRGRIRGWKICKAGAREDPAK